MAGDIATNIYKWQGRYWVKNDVAELTGPYATQEEVFESSPFGEELLTVIRGTARIWSAELKTAELIGKLRVWSDDDLANQRLTINDETFVITPDGGFAKVQENPAKNSKGKQGGRNTKHTRRKPRSSRRRQ